MTPARQYISVLSWYPVFIIGLLVPSNDPGLDLNDGTASASPFVIAIRAAGLKSIPSVST